MKIKFGGLVFDDFVEFSHEERRGDFKGEWGWSQVCFAHAKMLKDNGKRLSLIYGDESEWGEDVGADDADFEAARCGVEGCEHAEQMYVDMKIEEVEEIAE